MVLSVCGMTWGNLASIVAVCSFGGYIVHSILKTKFITPESLKTHCDNQQAACRPLMCNKIDQIKLEIKVMDEKREDARKELSEQLQDIHTFIGRVDQFMRDR